MVCIGGDGTLIGSNSLKLEWPSLLRELFETSIFFLINSYQIIYKKYKYICKLVKKKKDEIDENEMVNRKSKIDLIYLKIIYFSIYSIQDKIFLFEYCWDSWFN